MKEFAVKEIHKGTETSKLDLDTLSEQLSNLQQKVRNLYSLDDALKGKTGKAIRSYYNEIHTPFLTFLLQSMEDYKTRLENMKNDVQSFEPSHQGYISEGFLDNELHPGLDKAKSKVASVSENINQVLSSVADIRFVAQISYSDFETYIEKGKRQIDEVITDLGELDSKHASHLQETQSDLNTMKKYLSEMTTGLSSGAISISDFNAVSLQDMNAYNNVIQQSYGNGNIEITEDNIEYLPMAAIAVETKRAEEGMEEGLSVILDHAFQDLNQGNITRKDYYAILSTLNLSKRNLSDEEKDEEVPKEFIDYFRDNQDKLFKDYAKDGITYFTQQLGVQSKKIGEVLHELSLRVGIQGPDGPAKFVIPDKTLKETSDNFKNTGNAIGIGSKILGEAFKWGSFGLGWYEDVTKNGKTHGEAITHNGASLAVGTVMGGATTSILTTALFTAGVSNPVGWAVLGGMAVGTGLSFVFNYLYDENILGIQDGLDAVGKQLDNFGSSIKDTYNDAVDKAGEAIESGLEAINPMNWGW